MMSLMSESFAVVPFSLCMVMSAFSAIIRATVVFPVPGGPKNSMFGMRPLSIIFLSGFPFSKRCFCPKTLSIDFGLALSANGCIIIFEML